jgi:hypothetical protein
MIESQNISSKTKCVLQRYDYFRRIRIYLHETDLDLYNNYQINLDIYSNILLKTMYMCKIVSIINDISLETELLLSLENHLFVNDHNNGVQFVPQIYPHPDTGTSESLPISSDGTNLQELISGVNLASERNLTDLRTSSGGTRGAEPQFRIVELDNIFKVNKEFFLLYKLLFIIPFNSWVFILEKLSNCFLDTILDFFIVDNDNNYNEIILNNHFEEVIYMLETFIEYKLHSIKKINNEVELMFLNIDIDIYNMDILNSNYINSIILHGNKIFKTMKYLNIFIGNRERYIDLLNDENITSCIDGAVKQLSTDTVLCNGDRSYFIRERFRRQSGAPRVPPVFDRRDVPHNDTVCSVALHELTEHTVSLCGWDQRDYPNEQLSYEISYETTNSFNLINDLINTRLTILNYYDVNLDYRILTEDIIFFRNIIGIYLFTMEIKKKDVITCSVCFNDKLDNRILIRCGHSETCNDCLVILNNTTKKCPICRCKF